MGRTPPPDLFKKRYRSSLRNVLFRYSLIDPEIGYTQGMNFIAATVISTVLHYGTEDDYLKESSEGRSQADLEERSFAIFRYMM